MEEEEEEEDMSGVTSSYAPGTPSDRYRPRNTPHRPSLPKGHFVPSVGLLSASRVQAESGSQKLHVPNMITRY